jgi:hypothetical protein
MWFILHNHHVVSSVCQICFRVKTIIIITKPDDFRKSNTNTLQTKHTLTPIRRENQEVIISRTWNEILAFTENIRTIVLNWSCHQCVCLVRKLWIIIFICSNCAQQVVSQVFRSSGAWCCVTRWVCLNIWKDCVALIFRDKQSSHHATPDPEDADNTIL